METRIKPIEEILTYNKGEAKDTKGTLILRSKIN